MRPSWFVAAGIVCGPSSLRADGVGYQLDHYEPVPAGDRFLVVESPWYNATRDLAFDVAVDYAHDLLTARRRDQSGELVDAPSPIEHSSVAHLDVAVPLFDRIAITGSLPIVLDQRGTAFAGVGPSGTTIGDPRLGVRARALEGKVSIDGSVYVWLPIGGEAQLAGDAKPRGLARLIASGSNDRWAWAVNTGVLLRPRAVLSTTAVGNAVGNELQLGGAIGYRVLDHLSLGPELTAAIGHDRSSLEALATARFVVDDRFAIGVGAGTALAGSGAPDARVIVSLAYAPQRATGSRFERVIVLPDEDGHVGAVEVDDGRAKTLLDKAYASTEITRKTGTVRPVQRTANEVPPALARSLPPPDQDGDAIADAVDMCPDRAGVAAGDPLRHGCPASAEKIVVLPDEDGHVGAIEIDDGRGVTVLATAYATAEISTDGHVELAPPTSPKAIARTTTIVAAALPAPDADDDRILDLDDACPDQSGATSSDPIRNGCPATLERVIVMPDLDGHVGGVEVDDGTTKTLLDQPYAAAALGSDGKVAVTATTQRRSIDRAVAALVTAMPILDQDGDTIADDRDACPERPGVASPDPLRDGCPRAEEKIVLLPDADGRVGGLEVDDGTGVVVLDAAYASAEVRGKTATKLPAAGSIAMVRATLAMARTMPIADRDDDTIADADDACPDRSGPAAPAPRNGCPKTVEQVVVLPDENGAIGAIEVDDGTTKTVLDKQYAATEIGQDGKLRPLTIETSDVSTRYAEALAARPPGARIILYFTTRATPVRDITGPVDILVAEVNAKTGPYTIEVIGHTDQTGSEKVNVRIGKERAQLIADSLVKAGVPLDRVKVTSMGSREPAVKRKTTIVEMSNRRVEIWVR